MASAAYDKRMQAIRVIMDAYVTQEGERIINDTPAHRETLAELIGKLVVLGRTERWHNAIKRWENMVRCPDNDLDWAMLQGQVFAGYGAM